MSSGSSPIEVLPPAYEKVREAIAKAGTEAPNIETVKANVKTLSTVQRRRLQELVTEEFTRNTTADAQKHLSALNAAIQPSFAEDVRELPAHARRGIGEALSDKHRTVTYSLLGVAGFAWLMSAIREKGKKPGFLGKLIQWSGISALTGLILSIPALGRVAERRDIDAAESTRVASSIPANTTPKISDASLEQKNVYSLLSSRELQFGDTLAMLKTIPQSGQTPEQKVLSVRKANDAQSKERKFTITMLHKAGGAETQALDTVLYGLSWTNRDIKRTTDSSNATIYSIGGRTLLPENGVLQRNGTEIAFGTPTKQYFVTEQNMNAMLSTVSSMQPNAQTHTHILDVFTSPPDTPNRQKSTLTFRFDTVQ